ncbi:hypothetical protein [Pseudochrobactrum kiredjianiae]|uniref:Uncharacterized protein n=1 Tax=Pseudochrobactrum kiredjianiae TaxID=386305 RepID=A0ABW3V8N7_9HYPH|nr:hypothetical protein [Pseudochrobactrum kiredjianiae]MDM7850172.1 hypothetical protein [Pseudochrobactrum kiredjianiae]
MFRDCEGHLPIFSKQYVYQVQDSLEIIEKEEAGASTAKFSVTGKAVQICSKAGAALIVSLSEQKCADGAFLTFDESGAHLHIVELKGRVNQGTWLHILKQYEGMFLSALALSRLMNIFDIQKVTCYLAHKKLDVNFNGGQAILNKTLVGGKKTLDGKTEWNSKSIDLPHNKKANIILQQKDAQNNTDFGHVS